MSNLQNYNRQCDEARIRFNKGEITLEELVSVTNAKCATK